MNDYIDVRSAWPVYFNGMKAYKLEGFTRELTVEQARELIRDSEKVKEEENN